MSENLENRGLDDFAHEVKEAYTQGDLDALKQGLIDIVDRSANYDEETRILLRLWLNGSCWVRTRQGKLKVGQSYDALIEESGLEVTPSQVKNRLVIGFGRVVGTLEAAGKLSFEQIRAIRRQFEIPGHY